MTGIAQISSVCAIVGNEDIMLDSGAIHIT